MSTFEFILALYSIIAGLGISLLVRSIGQMIEARDRVRLYWVHSAWLLLIFVVYVVSWFGLWRFRDHGPWTTLQCLLLLCIPIMLYLVSHLSVPELDDGEVHDMREYYFAQCGWIQGLMLATILVTVVVQFVIEGHPDWSRAGIIRAGGATILIVGLVSRKPAVHAAQALLLLALMFVGVTYLGRPVG